MSGRQLAIFDLDGTLVKLHRDVMVEALWRFCQAEGYPQVTRFDLHRCTSEDAMFAFVQAEERPFMQALFWSSYAPPTRPLSPLQGAVGALRWLRQRGTAIAIVTGRRSPEAEVRAALSKAQLDPLVDLVISGGRKAIDKGELMYDACLRSGCPPRAAMSVGDTTEDTLAARRAGIGLVVAVLSGHIRSAILARSAPDAIIRSVGRLPLLLEAHRDGG